MEKHETRHPPNFLEPFDDDLVEQIAQQRRRADVSAGELATLLREHQRSIYGKVPESRYIDLRHEVNKYRCLEDGTTCFFAVSERVWSLEETNTNFSENELATIAAVHTRQTYRQAEEADQIEASELLEDRQGFVVYKPPFMKRAYQLQQKTLLSDREAEVQALVEEGHTSSTIATILGITTGAVDSIRYNRINEKVSVAQATVELLPAD